MRILVTGGPTREHIDEVRFITNASTGRMGCAVASAAVGRGHSVEFVTGPIFCPGPPDGVSVVRVTTALEMREAVLERVVGADALVMTAAVSDWRPRDRMEGKIEKGADTLCLELVPNPDILADAVAKNPGMTTIAFALEVGMDEKSALRKLEEKGADLVVLNSIEAMGADEAEYAVYSGPGAPVLSGRYAKEDLAERLVRLLEEMFP